MLISHCFAVLVCSKHSLMSCSACRECNFALQFHAVCCIILISKSAFVSIWGIDMENSNSEYLRENFGRLIRQLGLNLTAHRIHSEDITSISKVRFITNQKKLLSGLVYIGSQKQFDAMKDVTVQDGTALIACNASGPLLTTDKRYADATVIETSVSTGRVFNILNRLLANDEYEPTMDVRGGLLRTWDHIMNSKLLASSDIIDALSHSGVKPKCHYRFVVAAFDNINPGTHKFLDLRDEMSRLLPDCGVLVYNQTLLIMMFYDNRTFSTEAPDDRFEALLEKHDVYAMMGHTCREYSMMRTMYLLCQRSLDIAMNMSIRRPGRFFHINDYTMYYAIDMCAQRCAQIFGHMDIMLLIHPSIVAIRRYDIAHNSDLLEVMSCYIRNSGSITKTAEDMFVHRNTVNNKVSKIKSMLPFDLDDGAVRQLLLFSYQALRFYEDILKFEIRKE